MPPEVIEMLENLEGAVITRSSVVEGKARIIAVTESHTYAIILSGCEWDDERCSRCSCDQSRVSLRVERTP